MCDALLVILLRCIFFAFKLILPKQSVIINDDLGIRRKDRTLAGQSHRVDLNKLAVLLHEAIIEVLEKEDNLTLVLFKPQVRACLQKWLDVHSLVDVNGDLVDLLRVGVGHVLYRHPAGTTIDENRAALLAIQDHTEVILLLDVKSLDYVHAVTWKSDVPRLLRDECLTAHLFSDLLDLLRILALVHTSVKIVLLEVTQPAATPKHLSLHHIFQFLVPSKLLSHEVGLLAIERDVTQRDGHAVIREQPPSLVLVEFEVSPGEAGELGRTA
jgi:hypothetical protein